MSDGLDKMAGVFLDEANDLLDNLEDHLLELEQNPDDKETISAVFRCMHTIKGSSGMFGFNAVSHFTHEAETTFDEVRNGRVAVTPELITLTLKARDHIRAMLENSDTPEIAAESENLIRQFQVYLLKNDNTSGEGHPAAEKAAPEPHETQQHAQPVQDEPIESGEATWRITFEPSSDVFMNGTNPLGLLQELADMGTVSISPFFKNLPVLDEIDPCKCYVSWDIVLTTDKSQDEIKDVFIFVDDTSTVEIIRLTDSDQNENAPPKKLGEILLEKKLVTQAEIDAALGGQKHLGAILTEQKIVDKEEVSAALTEQKHLKAVSDKHNQESAQSTIKVNSEKLDKLIDLVGELVTFNARLTQLSSQLESPVLSTLGEQGERLILELRDTTMDMRMLPIGTIFSRFRRLVRDLSGEMHKDIDLITEGAETELDKTVIEKLNDPLVHLIRNSVDHGIELPADREAAGKPRKGTVTLSAQHAGAFVLITIEDDGAGLNFEKIKAKAVEKGLCQASDELSESEIADLIFQPGFSTADKVTSVSGRGVGMDVVKRDIISLGGTVNTTSKPGAGTKFVLKLPLTLAIIEGILIQLGDNHYVIPLSNVSECLEFENLNIRKGKFCSAMKIRDDMIPYIDLRTFFGVESEVPSIRQMVIVSDQSSKIGLVVDKVIGNYQTVIKPLGRLYQNVEGISGATILGDGSVALIIDVFKLSDIVRELDVNS